ncbi:hypothetical protein BZK37_17915 [Enterococcus casseliflavus]|nr:hypothetical protein BZK37_17915 [Enterococcus casseliflavus]
MRSNLDYNDSVKANTDFLNTLKDKLPEFFTNSGSFDLDKFKDSLKENNVEELSSGYRLDFIGKNYAKKQAGERPTTVIVPDLEHNAKDENKDSKNLFFTGDNLEVLRHLRQNYQNSIDVIYIDPPYNTGADGFVYPDKFEYSDEKLKDMFGLDDDGLRRLKSIQGRASHSAWLAFMYPRIYLARKLLKDTGVIFISIDDNEQANLKLLMDEVFGEGELVSEFVIIRSEGGGLAKQAIIGHDYLISYARSTKSFRPLGKPKDIRGKIVEKDGEQYWIETDWLRKEFGKYGTLHYEDILEIKGQEKLDEINEGLASGEYTLIDKGDFHIVGRLRKVADDTTKFYTVLKHLNKDGNADLEKLGFNGEFSYPKPVSLIKEFVQGATIHSKKGLILDFFAGSSTTADAVMQLNAEDGGNRQFIMVTLPEPTFSIDKNGNEAPTKGGKIAYAKGYRTIDEISRKRIEKAAKKIKTDNPLLSDSLDLGFKHYRVEEVAVNTIDRMEEFDPNVMFTEDLVADIQGGVDTMLTTWMVVDGYKFDEPVQKVSFGGADAYYLGNQLLYILDNKWNATSTKELLNQIGNHKININTIIVSEYALTFNRMSELKTNIKLLKDKDFNVKVEVRG